MKLLLAILTLISAVHVNAQERDPAGSMNLEPIRQDNSALLVRPFNNSYKGSKGSPYLFDEWRIGTIIALNGDSLKYQDLKYDVFEDQLLMLTKSERLAMIPVQGVIRSFVFVDSLGNDRVFYNTLTGEEDLKSGRQGFFELLYDGRYRLYAKHKKKFVKADYEGAYNKGRQYDEYKTDSKKYFLLDPEEVFIEIKGGKKGILKSLQDDGRLDKVVKERQLDLRKETDLIELIFVIDNNMQDKKN